MLSGGLKSETATKISLLIINAFVEMQNFSINNVAHFYLFIISHCLSFLQVFSGNPRHCIDSQLKHSGMIVVFYNQLIPVKSPG